MVLLLCFTLEICKKNVEKSDCFLLFLELVSDSPQHFWMVPFKQYLSEKVVQVSDITKQVKSFSDYW